MRVEMAMPHTVSSWCFWASFVTLMTIIVAVLTGAALGVARAEGAAEVLLKVVQFGFAGVVVFFLLGFVCSQIEGTRRKNSRG